MRGKRVSRIKKPAEETAPPPKPAFYEEFGFGLTVGTTIAGLVWVLFRGVDLWAMLSTGAWWAMLRFLATAAVTFAIMAVVRDRVDDVVSQFVLPVYSPEEREKARDHFKRHAGGKTSRAFWVQHGKIVASEGEAKERTAGVMLVDSASAVVLRTDLEITNAVGPGVTFLNANEYPVGDDHPEALDLRKQYRLLKDVTASTRDGVEVTADIGVTFMVDGGERRQPRDWQDPTIPPYAFEPKNAKRTFYARPYADAGESRWDHLPGVLAADVWREALKRADFNALFSAEANTSNLLSELQLEVANRLHYKRRNSSHEKEVLAECGIAVLDVHLFNLRLPTEIETGMIEQWKRQRQRRMRDLMQQRAQGPEAKAGLAAAAYEMLDLLTRYVRGQLQTGQEASLTDENILASLTEATRRLAEDNPTQAANHRRHIDALDMWAKRLQSETAHNPKD